MDKRAGHAHKRWLSTTNVISGVSTSTQTVNATATVVSTTTLKAFVSPSTPSSRVASLTSPPTGRWRHRHHSLTYHCHYYYLSRADSPLPSCCCASSSLLHSALVDVLFAEQEERACFDGRRRGRGNHSKQERLEEYQKAEREYMDVNLGLLAQPRR